LAVDSFRIALIAVRIRQFVYEDCLDKYLACLFRDDGNTFLVRREGVGSTILFSIKMNRPTSERLVGRCDCLHTAVLVCQETLTA